MQGILARHLALYRRKIPKYQTVMLNSLVSVWKENTDDLLDIGGGTGVIAQAMYELFPVQGVHAVDLVDRFCSTLTIPATQYDGKNLPFEGGTFQAATLNNVLHHVPVSARVDLLKEIRRVVNGPLYIKDHISGGVLDDVRLTILDALGNIPFDGMIKARYLRKLDWEELARATGYTIKAYAPCSRYRSGLMALLFPNRLEVTMRLEPA